MSGNKPFRMSKRESNITIAVGGDKSYMTKKIVWYELKRREWEPHPQQMVAAAMWICSLCSEVISGHSGIRKTLCERCGDDILQGKMKYVRDEKQ